MYLNEDAGNSSEVSIFIFSGMWVQMCPVYVVKMAPIMSSEHVVVDALIRAIGSGCGVMV